MRLWKWLGVAGLVGVAAVGVVAVQRRRARNWTEYSPEDLRSRLHARLASSRSNATGQPRARQLHS